MFIVNGTSALGNSIIIGELNDIENILTIEIYSDIENNFDLFCNVILIVKHHNHVFHSIFIVMEYVM